MGSLNPTALVAGAAYTVLGVVFLLDRFGVLDVSIGLVWPLLLVALGAGVLLGGRRAPERPPIEEERHVQEPPPAEEQPAEPAP